MVSLSRAKRLSFQAKNLLFRAQSLSFRSRRSGRGICFIGLTAALLVAQTSLMAQQPQAQSGQPLFPINAKYVNGVAPGYWPTAGTGLTLNLSAGTAFCGGAVQSYAGGTLTMTASATNNVYLNTAASCVPAVKTTAFLAADIPLALVVTNTTTITSITDDRTFFVLAGAAEVYNTAPSAGSTSIAATTMLTPAAAGTFRASFYLDQVAAGSGCVGNTTIAVNVIFTDPNALSSTTVTVYTGTISANGAAGTVLSPVDSSYRLRAKASTAIQFSATYTAGTGCTTNPTYQLFPILEGF